MLPDKLQPGIIAVRNTEAILGWTRNTFYSTINSAILGLVMVWLAVGTLAYSIVCIGGMILSASWYASAHRTNRLMKYWNGQLAELEIADGDVTHRRVFAGKQFEKIDRRVIKNHSALLFVIIIAECVWFALFAKSLIATDWTTFLIWFRRIIEWIIRIESITKFT